MPKLSNSIPITVTAATELASAAAGLTTPGQSTFGSIATLSGTGSYFHWASRGHYDPVRKKIFFCGRTQNASEGDSYAEYNELTNSWTSVLGYSWSLSNRGHSYDLDTYDPSTGIIYYLANGGQVDRIVKRTIGSGLPNSVPWTEFAVDCQTVAHGSIPGNVLYSGGPDFVSASSGMAFHPNLFGTGVPGLVIGTQAGILSYNINTDVYYVTVSKAAWDAQIAGSAMTTPSFCYCAGADAVHAFVGETSLAGGAAIRIDAWNDFTWLSDPPLPLGGDRGGANRARVCDDPTGGAYLYVFEYPTTAGNRVWKYSFATGVYSEIGTHPFQSQDSFNENFRVISFSGLGVIGAFEEGGSNTYRIRLWKPVS